jgi:hypothetical protein
MRYEGKADIAPGNSLKTLADFGQVPMAAHTVGLEIIRRFRKKRMYLGLAASAGHS